VHEYIVLGKLSMERNSFSAKNQIL